MQTSLLRALAPTTPTYVFPAMNTLMYEHPLTERHLKTIKDIIGYSVVGPIGKKLACGDVGKPPKAGLPCHTLTARCRARGNDRMAGHRADCRR